MTTRPPERSSRPNWPGKARRDVYPLVGTRALRLCGLSRLAEAEIPGVVAGAEDRSEPAAGSPAASVTNAPQDALGPLELLYRLVLSNRVYCMEPGVGFLLEQFYLQPRGLLQEMKFYPTNSLSSPLLSSAELAENEAFWKRAIETGVDPLLQLVAGPQLPRPAFEKPLMELGHLQTPPPPRRRCWRGGIPAGSTAGASRSSEMTGRARPPAASRWPRN